MELLPAFSPTCTGTVSRMKLITGTLISFGKAAGARSVEERIDMLTDGYYWKTSGIVTPTAQAKEKALEVLADQLCAAARVCPYCASKLAIVQGPDYTKQHFEYYCPKCSDVFLKKSPS